jgi:hypothetical protein
MAGSNMFSQLLSEFLRCFNEKRTGPFSVDAELRAAQRNLRNWLK